MANDEPDNGGGAETPSFESKLETGRERFLAHAIEHAFEVGRRTAADFVRHFPPAAIMEGLAEQPSLRAKILAFTTGIKPRIALKKAWASAGEDLQIALDERETDEETIVDAIDPDDRVRYLDPKKLWQFLIEGEFWNVSVSSKEDHRRARLHIAYLLERALQDRLVTHQDVVLGISVNELALRLPKAELGKLIEAALERGRAKKPFTDTDLLVARPPSVLVEHVPLPHIWMTVIEPKVAFIHGYVESGAPSMPPPSQDWIDVGGDDDVMSEREIEEKLTLPS
jgi:hypothetical protein